MEVGSLAQWFSAGVAVLALIISCWAAWRAMARSDEKAHREAIDGLSHRVTTIETAMKALPTGNNWAQLREDMAAVRGDVRTSATEIRGLGAGLKRIETQVSLLMENELRGTK